MPDRQIEDARMEGAALVMRGHRGRTMRVYPPARGLFDRAMGFAKSNDHATPGAYAARAEASAREWAAARGIEWNKN